MFQDTDDTGHSQANNVEDTSFIKADANRAYKTDDKKNLNKEDISSEEDPREKDSEEIEPLWKLLGL